MSQALGLVHKYSEPGTFKLQMSSTQHTDVGAATNSVLRKENASFLKPLTEGVVQSFVFRGEALAQHIVHRAGVFMESSQVFLPQVW